MRFWNEGNTTDMLLGPLAKETFAVTADCRTLLPRREPKLRVVGGRLRRLVGIIEELSFTTACHRLVSFLLCLARKEGKSTSEGVEMIMRVSNQELASQIDTVRELVSRNLPVAGRGHDQDRWPHHDCLQFGSSGS
jgi:hypothetical protein